MNFIGKKVKALTAWVCSAVMLVTGNSAVFGAFADYDAEDVRAKALAEYLLDNEFVVAMQNAVEEKISGMLDKTDKVTYEEITETEAVPFDTVKRLNSSLEAGQTKVVRNGVEGTKVRNVKIAYVNGTEVSRETVSEYVTTQPVSKIAEFGNRSADEAVQTSGDADFQYKYVLECQATAYSLAPEENGGYVGKTATGIPLDKGVIAVDPRVIPLGSRVYIEALDGSWSYGYAVAGDTGGAIKGNKVDLCYRTRSECIQFGRRKCRVYVL